MFWYYIGKKFIRGEGGCDIDIVLYKIINMFSFLEYFYFYDKSKIIKLRKFYLKVIYKFKYGY